MKQEQPLSTRICEQCRYWRNGANRVQQHPFGLCCRHSPSVMLIEVRDSSGVVSEKAMGIFPPVSNEDPACGEFVEFP